MSINYGRYPIVIARGEGCNLYDSDGRQYLDLFAGFGAGILGHCHPDLVRAVSEQASLLWHPGNLLHSEPQTRTAEDIARLGFGGRSFFCHSGADANEAAIKLARLHGHHRPGPDGPRFKVISALRSFHGRSFATMAATADPKVREHFGPLAPGFAHVPFNDIAAIEAEIDETTAAVIVEPIQGEGGIHVPADDYLPALRRLCTERDLLLIIDEVWTGCGRTGRYFAHQHWDIEPDVMTLGKCVGGGLAVGVMCTGPVAADHYNAIKQGGVKHASTLGGNCLAMAASHAVFTVLERDGLVARAEEMGRHVQERFTAMKSNGAGIVEVRGKGLFIGVELDKPAKEIVDACREEGVMINATQGSVLRVAPPLIVEPGPLDHGLDVIERALR